MEKRDSFFRAGFVAVVGKPNVGKSTILNCLLNEHIFAVSSKPQTTRQQIKGILNLKNAQIVFLDTPGFLAPRYELQNRMIEYIKNALSNCDVVIVVTDASSYESDYDKKVEALVKKSGKPKIVLFNKIDRLSNVDLANFTKENLQKDGFEKVLFVSAKDRIGLQNLVQEVKNLLPASEPLYDTSELSDSSSRFFAQEIIREQIFVRLKKEIPYSSTVLVDTWSEFPNKIVICATVYLEKNSQKKILIGAGGSLIKKIKIAAQKKLFKVVGKRIVLNLWVKTKRDWKDKSGSLNEFGYL